MTVTEQVETRCVKGHVECIVHPTASEMRRDAVISDDSRYRYKLTRRWGPAQPYVAWVMLNPSTADALKDDATIRKCIGFTQRWGFDALAVVNLFALRSRDPKALKRMSVEEAVGPINDQHIIATTKAAALTVCAWGANDMVKHRAEAVKRLIDYPLCLEVTKDGHPGHPLLIPYVTRLRLLP